MSTASFLPAAARARRWPKLRRLAAWLAATGLRSQSRALAGDRLCRRPCGALDPDPGQSEGGAGRPYGRRGSLRLGPEVPVRLWQASAALRLDRRPLVHGVSGRQLGDLRAGDGDARLRPRDLLADRAARGGSPPRLLRRGDAGALSDLQLQGLQVQSGPAAAGDAAAIGAGLSRRVREAQRAIRPVARPRRRAGADDEILGADHDRRGRAGGVAASGSPAVPALAGAMGRDRHAGGRDAAASRLAARRGFRAADLCRRCLYAFDPRPERAARAGLHRPQCCAAGAADRAGVGGAGHWRTGGIRRRCSRTHGRAARIRA